MVDIDKKLVRLCQLHLPEWSSGAFLDARARVMFVDAWDYVGKCRKKYDVIISDLTEPLKGGPSLRLFTLEFYDKIARILAEDGLFVIQAGAADLSYHQFFSSCWCTLKKIFPVVRPYWAFMFSFSSPWGFIIASRQKDPLSMDERTIKTRMKVRSLKKLRFYHPGIHHGLFSLPLYLDRALKKGRVLTEENPFIWRL